MQTNLKDCLAQGYYGALRIMHFTIKVQIEFSKMSSSYFIPSQTFTIGLQLVIHL